MNKLISHAAAAALLALPLLVACSGAPDVDGELDPDVDDETASEAVATSTDAATGRRCYCAGRFACTHSKSPSHMHAKARQALAAAGVSESALTQTYGDAPASVGTHCPEPGTTYSAASDLQQGSDPCARTRALRRQGFAAFFRTSPEFPGNLHIHAVYAGVPGMKASLKKQVESFLRGNNGLAREKVETHCPITQAEKNIVRSVYSGGTAPRCFVGGSYCGGNKVAGDPGTLYRCNADGSGTVIRRCASGCRINPGDDDSCR